MVSTKYPSKKYPSPEGFDGRRKVTKQLAKKIKRKHQIGWTITELAQYYKLSKDTIRTYVR